MIEPAEEWDALVNRLHEAVTSVEGTDQGALSADLGALYGEVQRLVAGQKAARERTQAVVMEAIEATVRVCSRQAELPRGLWVVDYARILADALAAHSAAASSPAWRCECGHSVPDHGSASNTPCAECSCQRLRIPGGSDE